MKRNVGTAARPLRLVIDHITGVSSNWPLNKSGSDYGLYFNKGFSGIPAEGDLTGLVAAVVKQAKDNSSGATCVRVTSHSVSVSFSGVISREEQKDFLRRAVLAAGLGRPVVK